MLMQSHIPRAWSPARKLQLRGHEKVRCLELWSVANMDAVDTWVFKLYGGTSRGRSWPFATKREAFATLPLKPELCWNP